ncbi:kinase-like protein [Neolentinus lepideus HHB14362 ss-1]|uniref:non-specific serine/threonine protein kinase n=1 Tax=Neolentinus lepideus HHB14362 ss-1 TaxID=1314782 RepID=A0A165MUI2_9AGAM|nr:kinase-like protein [Neolentinus lepideus HHB14362 ss-1]
MTTWKQRKARLGILLQSGGDDDDEGVALDRLLHGASVIGQTSKTKEVESLRFTDRDLQLTGTLEYGTFGVVSPAVDVVRCKCDGRAYVRKAIDKQFALRNAEQCFPQVERDLLLRALKHDSRWAPHLLCAYQTPTHLNLVMDYAEGGTLWDVLESSPRAMQLAESDVRWWAPQIVSAIHWCHSQGFVHRDIKPQNFVLAASARLQLIDFGSAAPLLAPLPDGSQRVPRRYCRVPCGTCDYISPEILAAHEQALVALDMDMDDSGDGYGRETDWWSAGVVLYEMVYGIAPFFAPDIRATYLRIVEHKASLRFIDAVRVSAELQDLLQRLLTDCTERLGRYGVSDILAHGFFAGTPWADLHARKSHSEDLHVPQYTYATPHSPSGSHSHPTSGSRSHSQGFAFSALFESSPAVDTDAGLSLLHATPAQRLSRSPSHERAVASFIGFSWGPKADAFPESGEVAAMRTPRAASVALSEMVTPLRKGSEGPARRTDGRRRVTDREAMKQLLEAVGVSARKKVMESGRKPRGVDVNGIGRARSASVGLRFDETMAGEMEWSEYSGTEGPPSPSPSPRPMRSRSPTLTLTRGGSLEGMERRHGELVRRIAGLEARLGALRQGG